MAYTCTKVCLNTTAVDQLTYLVLKGDLATTNVSIDQVVYAVDRSNMTVHGFLAWVYGTPTVGTPGRIVIKLSYLGTDGGMFATRAKLPKIFLPSYAFLTLTINGNEEPTTVPVDFPHD